VKVDIGVRKTLQAEASLTDTVRPGAREEVTVLARNYYPTAITVTFVSSVTPPGLTFENVPQTQWTASVPVNPSPNGRPGRNGDAAWMQHDAGGPGSGCPAGKHHSVIVTGHYYNPASDHRTDLRQGVLSPRCQ
jgi:hypothetical protein